MLPLLRVLHKGKSRNVPSAVLANLKNTNTVTLVVNVLHSSCILLEEDYCGCR